VQPSGLVDGIRRRECQPVQRGGDAVEVPLRQVQVDDGVVQIHVAEKELNRSQVRPGFKEMGGVRMTHQMGRHAFLHTRALAGADTRVPQHLRGNRLVRAPVGDRARKQVVGGRIQR
jgi:hypothetical protein